MRNYRYKFVTLQQFQFQKSIRKPTYSVTDCIRLQTVSGYILYPVTDCIRLRLYPVTDCIQLQTVSGYRLYSVTDCIRLQTVSGYRLYPVTDGIRLQTVSGYRLYPVTDQKFRKLSFFKTEVKDFNLIRAIFFILTSYIGNL